MSTEKEFEMTTAQPSTYFGGDKEKTKILLEDDGVRKILTIPFKEGDNIGFGEATSTGSMREAISDDTITIILLDITEEDLQIGDIISINSERVKLHDPKINLSTTSLLHRVSDIRKINGTTYYQTKGDNLEKPDSVWWTINDVKGKVIGILYSFLGVVKNV